MQQPEEEMSVDIELDDGTVVHCTVETVLEVDGRDYIVLGHEDKKHPGETEIWFYRLIEDPNDPNAEPELEVIESDEEYEAVEDRFDEYLDELEFDELSDGR